MSPLTPAQILTASLCICRGEDSPAWYLGLSFPGVVVPLVNIRTGVVAPFEYNSPYAQTLAIALIRILKVMRKGRKIQSWLDWLDGQPPHQLDSLPWGPTPPRSMGKTLMWWAELSPIERESILLR